MRSFKCCTLARGDTAGTYQEPKILVPRNLISPLRVFLGTMITSGLYLTSSLRTHSGYQRHNDSVKETTAANWENIRAIVQTRNDNNI
ncbi:hypothetical protein ANTQUA_LOCUS6305 [Anthophora quadrimaculata]